MFGHRPAKDVASGDSCPEHGVTCNSQGRDTEVHSRARRGAGRRARALPRGSEKAGADTGEALVYLGGLQLRICSNVLSANALPFRCHPRPTSRPFLERRARIPRALGSGRGSKRLCPVPLEREKERAIREREGCCLAPGRPEAAGVGPGAAAGPSARTKGRGPRTRCPSRRSVPVRTPSQPQKPPHPSARHFLPGPSRR